MDYLLRDEFLVDNFFKGVTQNSKRIDFGA